MCITCLVPSRTTFSRLLARLRRLLLMLLCLGLFAGPTGCGEGQDADQDGPQTDGQSAEPLVFVFQKQKDPTAIRQKADELTDRLAQKLGREVKAFVPASYSASVAALLSQQADFAYVSSIPYLLIRRESDPSLLLAEVRVDPQGQKRTSYDSVFVVRRDSPIQSMKDIVANAAELRMCFTSRTSTSGYVMAYSRLVDEGLLETGQNPAQVFESVAFANGYGSALQQVLSDQADLCAVSYYTLEGPRADVYTSQAERDQLRIVARTPHVPTHLICAREGIDPQTTEAVKRAILEIAQKSPHLLGEVYGATEFAEVDGDEHVAATAEAIQRLGIGLAPFDKRQADREPATQPTQQP